MSLNDTRTGATHEGGSTPTTNSNPTDTGANSGTNNRPRNARRDARPNNVASSTQKDFKGATPDIGGVLALRSENVSVKTHYDKFCEKLETYIMKELKGGNM